jgi:alkylation response protein AidB-like acyl-CoA dehydrogenase
MTDGLRPEDYLAYRDAARGVLTRYEGMAAIRASGLDEVLGDAEPADDLTPAYAFLEAQGYRAAVTPALGILGLAASAVTALTTPGPATLLAFPLGATDAVVVPGLLDSSAVAVDRLGTGLITVPRSAVTVRAEPAPVADGYLSVVDVDLTAGRTLIPEEEMNGWRLSMLGRTRLGAAAEMIGLIDRILDDAIAYARQRVQFGRSVSGFQAMQHLLAWAATERHQAICLFDLAVARSAHGPAEPALTRAVKAMAGRVLHTIVQAATQATGAISFAWEYSLNRLHRRGLGLDLIAGASADLIAEMGREIRILGSAPGLIDLCDVAP